MRIVITIVRGCITRAKLSEIKQQLQSLFPFSVYSLPKGVQRSEAQHSYRPLLIHSLLLKGLRKSAVKSVRDEINTSSAVLAAWLVQRPRREGLCSGYNMGENNASYP